MSELRQSLLRSLAAEGVRPVSIEPVHPITATVRPLNERLWILHQRCAAGVITESEEAELDVLCALAEQQYQKEHR